MKKGEAWRMTMFKLHVNKDFRVGIGDLSQMIGVSTRQLRYWESKGYIKSLAGEEGSTRKFSIGTCYRAATIRAFLDEGYTLAKAVAKTEQVKNQVAIVRHFENVMLKDIKVTDEDKGYGEIDYGYLANEPTKKVYGVIDENGYRMETREVNADETN